MIKTRIEILEDILNAQQNKVIACEIDLTIYEKMNLIAKIGPEGQRITQKIAELKAVKARAEETIEVIKKMIVEKDDKKIN